MSGHISILSSSPSSSITSTTGSTSFSATSTTTFAILIQTSTVVYSSTRDRAATMFFTPVTGNTFLFWTITSSPGRRHVFPKYKTFPKINDTLNDEQWSMEETLSIRIRQWDQNQIRFSVIWKQFWLVLSYRRIITKVLSPTVI